MATTVNPFPDHMDPVLNLLKEQPRENWQWDFQPDANGLNKINALALGNAALLTYSNQAGVQRFLQQWRFSAVELLRGFHTQGFVARQDDTLIVAFRGTEPINADDWLSDVNYHQRPLLPTVPGLVHGGFARAMEEVLQPLGAAVEKLSQGRVPRLFVTGHSLGGALAILCAAVLQFHWSREVTAVYTYGQPRVGDATFSDAFDGKLGTVTFRYVNDRDIVPHLPPVRLPNVPTLRLPSSLVDFLKTIEHTPLEVQNALSAIVRGERFAHVGRLQLFLPDGTVTDDERLWQQRELIYSGTLEELFRDGPTLLRARLGQVLLEDKRIFDHDPLNGYLPNLERL